MAVEYIIGKEPYLYKAKRINDLNLGLYKWRAKRPDKDGNVVKDWCFMEKYAPSLQGAMSTFIDDAVKSDPVRHRKKVTHIEGAEEIITHVDEITRHLEHIATEFVASEHLLSEDELPDDDLVEDDEEIIDD